MIDSGVCIIIVLFSLLVLDCPLLDVPLCRMFSKTIRKIRYSGGQTTSSLSLTYSLCERSPCIVNLTWGRICSQTLIKIDVFQHLFVPGFPHVPLVCLDLYLQSIDIAISAKDGDVRSKTSTSSVINSMLLHFVYLKHYSVPFSRTSTRNRQS